MEMPIDYHVWGTCYAGTLSNTQAKSDQHHAERNERVLSTIRNDLLHKFINKAIVSFLQQISIVGGCNWWAMTL